MQTRPAVGVAAIVIKNKKVLLGKRLNSHGAGTWAFPGGHLEFGESIEETGLSIKNLQRATFTNDIFEEEKKHYATLFVVSEYDSGKLQLKEPDKCEKWDWFSWNAFPKPLFLSLKNLLDQGFDPNSEEEG